MSVQCESKVVAVTTRDAKPRSYYDCQTYLNPLYALQILDQEEQRFADRAYRNF